MKAIVLSANCLVNGHSIAFDQWKSILKKSLIRIFLVKLTKPFKKCLQIHQIFDLRCGCFENDQAATLAHI